MRMIRRAAIGLLLLLALAGFGSIGSQATGVSNARPEDTADAGPAEPEPRVAALEEPATTPEKEAEEAPTAEEVPLKEEPPAEEPPKEEPPKEEAPKEEPKPFVAAKPAASTAPYSEDAYNQIVADVLGSITNDSMTKRETARAIFDYARGRIRYTGTSDKSDWKKGAYTGMTAKQGDCFTYYAVSRALLTAAGIDNLTVTREGGPTSHYWNLVNCGDGWYHFDATPRSSKLPPFDSFMFTDEEAADYTARAGRSYFSFDGSLLPARAGSEAEAPAPAEEEPPAQPVDTAPADTVPVDTIPATEDAPAAESTSVTEDPPAEDATEPGESSDQEPVLPENESPSDAGVTDPAPEPPAEGEISN